MQKLQETWVWSFDPWIRKIPWRTWQPTPVFLPEESHEQSSLQAMVYRVSKSWIQLRQLSTRDTGATVINRGSASPTLLSDFSFGLRIWRQLFLKEEAVKFTLVPYGTHRISTGAQQPLSLDKAGSVNIFICLFFHIFCEQKEHEWTNVLSNWKPLYNHPNRVKTILTNSFKLTISYCTRTTK